MQQFLHSFLVVVLTLNLIYAPVFALPIERKVANPTLPKAAPVVPQITKPHKGGELLVKFRFGVPQWMKQQIKDAWSKESKELKGKKGIEKFKLKDGITLAQTIADLQQIPNIVEWAEPNYLLTKTAVQTLPTPNDPQFTNQWALENTGLNGGTLNSDIRAKAAWSKGTGSDKTIIAVIDTGVDTNHADLKNNLWVNQKEDKGKKNQDDDNNGFEDDLNGWNFVNDTPNVSDDHNHGTNMAGVIAAQGNNSIGMTGVLWQASLMTLKALDASGTGYVSDVVEAMDYAADNGASVINCSFGTEAQSVALREAITRAGQSGALVVTSAGNDGQDLANAPQYPAAFTLPNLLTVAATTNQDFLAVFSNYGSTVHVGAPGIDVLTTQRGGGYIGITGTSIAAALVSGVAGLLKTQRGWVSGYAIRQAIIDGARQVGFLQGKVTSSGVVNAGEAITKLLSAGNSGNNGNGGGSTGGGNNGNNGGGNNGGGNNGGGNNGGTANLLNLDYMRANAPGGPLPRVTINNLPAPGYDDPDPGSGNQEGYGSASSQTQNDTGRAGAKIGQESDPTDGQSATGNESINIGSQNINYSIPLMALTGRAGFNLALLMSFNSNGVWMKDPWSGNLGFNADTGIPAPGWKVGFGQLQGASANATNIPPFKNKQKGDKYTYIWVAPDGTRHTLVGGTTATATNLYVADDSSYIRYNNSSRIMWLPDGTIYTFTIPTNTSNQLIGNTLFPSEIKDRNGNKVTITNARVTNDDGVPTNGDWGIDYLTDTLGRVIDFCYQSNRLTRVRQLRNANSATPSAWPGLNDAAWYN